MSEQAQSEALRKKHALAYSEAQHTGRLEAWMEAAIAGKLLIDALAQPAGWRLVPVEPTPEMVAGALKDCNHIGGGSCGERVSVDGDDMRSVWEAMLAAAPTPAPTKGEPA
jgi:hypothetical protein